MSRAHRTSPGGQTSTWPKEIHIEGPNDGTVVVPRPNTAEPDKTFEYQGWDVYHDDEKVTGVLEYDGSLHSCLQQGGPAGRERGGGRGGDPASSGFRHGAGGEHRTEDTRPPR